MLSRSHIIYTIDDDIKDIGDETDIIIFAYPVISKNHDLLMGIVDIYNTLESIYSFTAKNISTAKIRNRFH